MKDYWIVLSSDHAQLQTVMESLLPDIYVMKEYPLEPLPVLPSAPLDGIGSNKIGTTLNWTFTPWDQTYHALRAP
jgi:hypothetical protein